MKQKRFSFNLILGGILLAITLIPALVGLLWTPYDPEAMNSSLKLAGVSIRHIYGCDNFGRDIFSRIMAGSGITMRINDVALAFPSLLLALVMVSLLGTGKYQVMLALGIAFVPSYARIVRSEYIRIKNLDYVKAARLAGASDLRIMFVHILPNTKTVLLSSVMIGFNNAILAEAGLSFLGIGVQQRAGNERAHRVAHDADAGDVDVFKRAARHIIHQGYHAHADGADARIRVGLAAGEAVVVGVHGDDHDAAAAQLNGRGVLHLGGVEEAVARHHAGDLVVGRGVFGNEREGVQVLMAFRREVDVFDLDFPEVGLEQHGEYAAQKDDDHGDCQAFFVLGLHSFLLSSLERVSFSEKCAVRRLFLPNAPPFPSPRQRQKHQNGKK